MIDFDINEFLEEIKNFPYEDKLYLLEYKGHDIERLIEKL